MCRKKFLSVVLFSALTAGIICVACKDDKPDPEADGKKAGTEMCACVTDIAAPVIPNPPQGVNPLDPDLTDPTTLQWLGEVQAVYEAYFAALGNCAGLVASKYQKYFVFSIASYNPEIGLFSAFDFKDKDFEKGFLSATQACAEAFEFK